MTESDAGSPTTGPTIPRRPGIGEVLSFTGFLYGIGLMIHFRWLFLVVAVVFLVIGVARACAKALSGESSTLKGRAGVRTGKNHRDLFPLATAVLTVDSQVRPDQVIDHPDLRGHQPDSAHPGRDHRHAQGRKRALLSATILGRL